MKTKHHIIPTSIGGPKYNPENIYFDWSDKEHYSYHQIFSNRPPLVAIKIIEGFTDENGDWDDRLMSSADYQNIKKAFPGKKPAEAADFIKKEFLPIQKKWLRGELPEIDNPRDKIHPKKRKKNRKRA